MPRALLVIFTLSCVACDVDQEEQLALEPHENQVQTATATSLERVRDFVGIWENEDPDTRHITRVEILQGSDKGELVVHIWGACRPEDCYWGEVTTAVIDDDGTPTLSLAWNFTNPRITQKLTLSNGQRLNISTNNEWHEPRAFESHEIDYLIRSL